MNPASPLDQLKDIHLPEAVSIWPFAWPWWALIISTLALITFIVLRHKKNKWRRQALAELKNIATNDELSCIQQCNRLLKQVALYRYGQSCASLSGEKWLEFLDSKIKVAIFTESFNSFAFAIDQPREASTSIDVIQLKKAIENWIRKHSC